MFIHFLHVSDQTEMVFDVFKIRNFGHFSGKIK